MWNWNSRPPKFPPPYLRCKLCPKGSDNHTLAQCEKFTKLSPQNRRDLVAQNHLCYNCMSDSHAVKDCESKRRCQSCCKAHHSMLHLPTATALPTQMYQHDTPPQPSSSAATGSDQTIAYQGPGVCLTETRNVTSVLPTITVLLTAKNGRTMVAKAILDSAADTGVIRSECCSLLRVKPSRTETNLSGLSENQVESAGMVEINISTPDGRLVAPNYPMIAVKKITGLLPPIPLDKNLRKMLEKFPLADKHFDVPSKPDLILAVELYALIVNGPPLPLGPSLPAVMSTVFGYVVLRKTYAMLPLRVTKPLHPPHPRTATALVACICNNELNQKVANFWKFEEADPPQTLKPEEIYAEKLYSETTIQLPSKKYQVELPFRPDAEKLGESYSIAVKRFHQLEMRFRKNPVLKEKYVQYMKDYEGSGFMHEVTPPSPDVPHYYMSHHGVINESSSSTKLRTVYDASMKTSNGKSLNDLLLPGPSLLEDIPLLLLNFRRFPTVFSGDIKQMYLQIELSPKHHLFQLIVWRPEQHLPLKTYALTTVCFGVNCSPFLAIRTIKQIIIDHGHKFPRAAKALADSLYMDDLIYGEFSETDAKTLLQEIILLLKEGGFFMRKWTSNNPAVLSDFPVEDLEVPKSGFADPVFKILGAFWACEKDIFSYKIKDSESINTKRGLLSLISSIFDPLGFLTPVIFKAKAFMQELWLLNLGWDDTLPRDIIERWDKFANELHLLSSISIPRYIDTGQKPVQVHCFCDASEVGMACLLYLRSLPSPLKEENAKINLIIGKSRVAPLKKVSLPKLELNATALSAQILKRYVPKVKEFF